MLVYDEEYISKGFTFLAGKLTTKLVLGICLNLEDEEIVSLINNYPEVLAERLQEIMPHVIFREAHYQMHWIADENGRRDDYGRRDDFCYQWKDYFRSCDFKELSKLKVQAELILNNQDSCSPRAINNAKIVLECLNGNYPPTYYKEKTPEEKAKASYERKKPKLRTKLVIRDGYKCDNCGKDKEDSLCIIQKEAHNTNYELNNLTLRCRGCMNKMKKK